MSERLYRALDDLPQRFRQGVVCIGNFDGVHLGHQAVVREARRLAKRTEPVLIVCFEPHPRLFFRPDQPFFRLTSLAARTRLLHRYGVDAVLALPFDAAMAARSPEQFVREILCDQLQVRRAIVGYDFHFGKGRAGTPARLQELGRRHGFAVHVLEAVRAETENAPYASTAIRAALKTGDMAHAAAALGRWWTLEGTVQKGDQRGRTLGFPTANIALGDYLPPAYGIYTIAAERLAHADQAPLLGVASLGVRPQFALDAPLLEAHLFDFNANLYGEELAVALLQRQRPEQKFASLAELKAQMHKDAERARREAAGLLRAYRFLV